MNTDTVEDLLRPRFKVIAMYPYCPYEIGDLVEFSDLETSFHCTTTKEWDVFTETFEDSVNYFSIDVLGMWPHLFKKLEWWEERKDEELPRFVSYPNKETVYKVTYLCESRVFRGVTNNGQKVDAHLTYTQPATESEYLNQSK